MKAAAIGHRAIERAGLTDISAVRRRAGRADLRNVWIEGARMGRLAAQLDSSGSRSITAELLRGVGAADATQKVLR